MATFLITDQFLREWNHKIYMFSNAKVLKECQSIRLIEIIISVTWGKIVLICQSFEFIN